MKIKEIEPDMITNDHLCTACFFNFPECAGNPILGDGIGNDNVIECSEFKTATTE